MTDADCRCALCREPVDDWAAQVAGIVREHGWQVTLVGSGQCDCGHDDCDDEDDGPAFAYTIGLWHQARHPELLMSGQKGPLMHRALNAAARGVMNGNRLVPGITVEGVIGGFPVLVDELSDEGLTTTVLGAHHFHDRAVPALQLVWPSTHGVWGWQPGAPAFVEELQPQVWRVPAERTGAVAVDPEWLLPVPPDHMAFTCVCVLEEGAPVRLVTRQSSATRDEDWDVLCGEVHEGEARDWLKLAHISHAVRSAPSILEVADLQLDEQAERADNWSAWVRSPVPPDAPEPPPVRKRRWWR